MAELLALYDMGGPPMHVVLIGTIGSFAATVWYARNPTGRVAALAVLAAFLPVVIGAIGTSWAIKVGWPLREPSAEVTLVPTLLPGGDRVASIEEGLNVTVTSLLFGAVATLAAELALAVVLLRGVIRERRTGRAPRASASTPSDR